MANDLRCHLRGGIKGDGPRLFVFFAVPSSLKLVRQQLTQLPALAVFTAYERLGIGSIGGTHRLGIPMEFLAGAVGDVAEVVGLCQQTGVLEVAQGRCAAFAGIDPVLVVAVC